MADSNEPEWFTLSENFFETAIALGNSAFKDVKITLSDDPDRPEYHLHKVILAAEGSSFTIQRRLTTSEPCPSCSLRL